MDLTPLRVSTSADDLYGYILCLILKRNSIGGVVQNAYFKYEIEIKDEGGKPTISI